MAEKRAKKSELEKFTEFAELELKRGEIIKKVSGAEGRLEGLKKYTPDSYAKEKTGAKPVAPQDASPVLEPAVFLWIGLGILLIVAPIILFIIGVNMQSQSVDSDPMGIYTIVFILIVLAFIFVKRCFENAGDLLSDYKSDLAIHNEYPTKKYQYDMALKKWDKDYAEYKRKYIALKASTEKELEELEEELSNLESEIANEYKICWIKFDDEVSLTMNEKEELIEDETKVRTFGKIKEQLIHINARGLKQKVSMPAWKEDYKAILEHWLENKKEESFCVPLAELIKKKLEENKKCKILNAANEVLDELYAFAQDWKDLVVFREMERIEAEERWELCNSCWKLYGGKRECPMAPRSECAAYEPK